MAGYLREILNLKAKLAAAEETLATVQGSHKWLYHEKTRLEAELATARREERERCAVFVHGFFAGSRKKVGEKAAAAIRALTDGEPCGRLDD